MDIFVSILLIVIGLALLTFGANFFVDGASGIAEKLKISVFVIGMTIVAFGTSAPELAVSIKSAISGNGDIAMGNAIGSNIINILLILGVAACIRPLTVKKKTAMIEIPFLIAITGLLIIMTLVGGAAEGHAGVITRWEGGILIAFLAVYVAYMVASGVRERRAEKQLSAERLPVADPETLDMAASGAPQVRAEKPPRGGLFGLYDRLKTHTWFLIIITLAGLAGVVFGAEFVVSNVDKLTGMMNDSNIWKKILSVTVVALGTSLPELVTSIVAAAKGNTDLALGNIIGSNILNILIILGLPALIAPIAFVSDYLWDVVFALGAAVLLLFCVLIGRGKAITRVGGVIMLLSLGGYLTYLFLSV